MYYRLFHLACLFWLAMESAEAQTKLMLATITPGTEDVQLVYNGDFQFQGTLAPTPNELPVEGTFVPLNIDGQALPSDWYLRLADQASRMLRSDISLRAPLPITP